MHAATESHQGRRRFAGNVEAIRIVVDGWVAVGGRGVGDDECAGWEDDAAELDIVDRDTQRGEDDRRMTDQFLNSLRREFGMLGEQRPLVGVRAQHLYGCGQLIAGGVGSGVEQDRDEADQLVVGEPVAVVLSRMSSEIRSSARDSRRRAINSSI